MLIAQKASIYLFRLIIGILYAGSKYSIHTVEVFSAKENMTYMWKFTAYFRGESYGDHVNGIFYNDNQCWLYLE